MSAASPPPRLTEGAAATVAGRPATAPTGETIVDTAVYSADSSDVTPPVPVRRMQPDTPPPGMRLQDLPLVEVLVSASGDVESVRLLSSSDTVFASGMVSVVKAWRFHPATRNGRPVRYRHRFNLTGRSDPPVVPRD